MARPPSPPRPTAQAATPATATPSKDGKRAEAEAEAEAPPSSSKKLLAGHLRAAMARELAATKVMEVARESAAHEAREVMVGAGDPAGDAAVFVNAAKPAQQSADSVVAQAAALRRKRAQLALMATVHVQTMVRAWLARREELDPWEASEDEPLDLIDPTITQRQSSVLRRNLMFQVDAPKIVAIVGWQHNFGRVLRALDKRLPKGSYIFILSNLPVWQRRRDLGQEGLNEDGGALEVESFLRPRAGEKNVRKTSLLASDGAAAARPPRRGKSADKPPHAPMTPIPGIGGLENCNKIEHRVGNPTEEIALRQLPLLTMSMALVFADEESVGKAASGPLRSHGGTELLMKDSEAITSTLLLREMHAQAHRAARRRGRKGAPPLTIVTQVVDVLTQRLLEMEQGLLEPKGHESSSERQYGTLPPTNLPEAKGGQEREGDDPIVESIVLQRNQLETAALTIAAMRGASWSAIRRLLDPDSGTDVSAFYAHQCLTASELIDPPPDDAPPAPPPGARSPGRGGSGRGAGAAGAGGGGAPRELSFWDLTVRMKSLGLGILIGWRRPNDVTEADKQKRGQTSTDADRASTEPDGRLVNPSDKDEKKLWRAHDQLIVLRRRPAADEAGDGAYHMSRMSMRELRVEATEERAHHSHLHPHSDRNWP